MSGVCPAYRKLRLFACTCCRRILHRLPDPVCRAAVDALNDLIEGKIDEATYLQAYLRFNTTRRGRFPKYATPDDEAWNAVYCAVHRRWQKHFDEHYAEDRWRYAARVAEDAANGLGTDEKREQSKLLREIFGDPFHPSPPLPEGVLAWNDATVRRLAESIYAERAWGKLPVLADALVDAGCEQEEVIEHCRSEGPHMRGCWAVDLVLGKS
jgi:hypothetical protein